MGQKRKFPKLILDHFGVLQQVFLVRFDPVVTLFGPWKNCLKVGRFGTKKWAKMGQTRVIPKVMLDHLGCSNKRF